MSNELNIESVINANANANDEVYADIYADVYAEVYAEKPDNKLAHQEAEQAVYNNAREHIINVYKKKVTEALKKSGSNVEQVEEAVANALAIDMSAVDIYASAAANAAPYTAAYKNIPENTSFSDAYADVDETVAADSDSIFINVIFVKNMSSCHMSNGNLLGDPPLDCKGIKQAEALGEDMARDLTIDLICTSQLLRAIQTGILIRKKLKESRKLTNSNINIVPYISENNKSLGNTPIKFEQFDEQTRLAHDISIMEHQATNRSDFSLFESEIIPHIRRTLQTKDEKRVFNVIVVSHGGFLKDSLKRPELENGQMIVKKYQFYDDQIDFKIYFNNMPNTDKRLEASDNATEERRAKLVLSQLKQAYINAAHEVSETTFVSPSSAAVDAAEEARMAFLTAAASAAASKASEATKEATKEAFVRNLSDTATSEEAHNAFDTAFSVNHVGRHREESCGDLWLYGAWKKWSPYLKPKYPDCAEICDETDLDKQLGIETKKITPSEFEDYETQRKFNKIINIVWVAAGTSCRTKKLHCNGVQEMKDLGEYLKRDNTVFRGFPLHQIYYTQEEDDERCRESATILNELLFNSDGDDHAPEIKFIELKKRKFFIESKLPSILRHDIDNGEEDEKYLEEIVIIVCDHSFLKETFATDNKIFFQTYGYTDVETIYMIDDTLRPSWLDDYQKPRITYKVCSICDHQAKFDLMFDITINVLFLKTATSIDELDDSILLSSPLLSSIKQSMDIDLIGSSNRYECILTSIRLIDNLKVGTEKIFKVPYLNNNVKAQSRDFEVFYKKAEGESRVDDSSFFENKEYKKEIDYEKFGEEIMPKIKDKLNKNKKKEFNIIIVVSDDFFSEVVPDYQYEYGYGFLRRYHFTNKSDDKPVRELFKDFTYTEYKNLN